MVCVNLKSLIGMLNTSCTQALITAAGLCLSRNNYHVEAEHWLAKLLKSTQDEVTALLKSWGIDTSKLAADAQKTIERLRIGRLKTGNSSRPWLLLNAVDLAPKAWPLGGMKKAHPGVQDVLYHSEVDNGCWLFNRSKVHRKVGENP